MSLTLALLVATSTSAGPVPMQLAEGSAVTFTAHQTFSSTDGHFWKFDGRFLVDRGDLSRSKVEVTIDVASIDTDNDSRDEHLRNPDFFDVKEHPKMTFSSTSIAPKNAEGWVTVKGKLQVKGRTVPVSFDMQLDWRDDGGVRARGRLTVSRKKLGLDYEAPFYIPSIKDKVNIGLDVKLAPKG